MTVIFSGGQMKKPKVTEVGSSTLSGIDGSKKTWWALK